MTSATYYDTNICLVIVLSHCNDLSNFRIKEPVVQTNVSATLRVLRAMGIPYLSCSDWQKADLERHHINWSFAFNTEIEAQKAAYRCSDSIICKIQGLGGLERGYFPRVFV